MSISIIIPVYNGQEWLEPCLNSCANQSYNDIEIIIVNDGSTDDTEIIIKDYCEKYPDVFQYFYIDNCGPSLARKYGINKSTNEFVCFLDADDYFQKNTIELLMNEQKNGDKDSVIGQFNILYTNGKIKQIKKYRLKEKTIISDYLMQNLPCTLWPCLYKKSILEKLFYPPQIVGEDFILNCQVFSIKKLNVGIVDSIIYTHRIHSLSVTHTSNEIKKEENFKAYVDGIKIIFEKDDKNFIQHRIPLCFNMLVFLYSLIISRSKNINEIEYRIRDFTFNEKLIAFCKLKTKIKMVLVIYYIFNLKSIFK
jgi:glycosyltransferase involved in cell wall biosynthesis